MKKMIAMFTSVLFILSLVVGAFAEEIPSTGSNEALYSVPETVPLASVETLKAYALTMVRKVSVQVYGRSVSGKTYSQGEYNSTDADPNMMAKVASSLVLRFSATTDDIITSYVAYETGSIRVRDFESDSGYSETAFSLFWGSKEFKLEQGKGGVWQIPNEAYSVEVDFYQVPLIIPGMSDANIVTEDAEGNQNGYLNLQNGNNYWFDRGVLLLTKEMTGRKGKLVITMKDNSRVIYNLLNGEKVPVVEVESFGFKPIVKGVRSVPENTANIVFEDGDSLIRTSYSKDMWSEVTFPSGLERYPIKVSVIYTKVLAENPQAEWMEFNPYTTPVKFRIQVGQAIFIRFDYPSKALPLNGPHMDGKG